MAGEPRSAEDDSCPLKRQAHDPGHGIGAVSIDGGAESSIDFYASARAGNQLMWSSPSVSNGSHVLKICVTGSKNASSTNNFVAVDRVDVSSGSCTPSTCNWTCANGNCMNCSTYTSCAPGGSGCPWGTVWTDNGTCH